MKKINKNKRYIVIIDNSGFDSETEIKYMTRDEIAKACFRDYVAIIDGGNVIKSFYSKFDIGRLK